MADHSDKGLLPIRPVRRRWHALPEWLFYIPIALGVLAMLLRHRSLSAPLNANWRLANGGLYPLSKAGLFELFPPDSGIVPRFCKVEADASIDDVMAAAKTVAPEPAGPSRPIVLKPDSGFRGRNVQIAENGEALAAAWAARKGERGAWLIQQYVPGFEASVFYVRRSPNAPGRLISMTRKQGFKVTGDGRATVAQLINTVDADRATQKLVAACNRPLLDEIPSDGATLELAPVRNHNIGATFHDITDHITGELEAALSGVLDEIDGYCFGRLDIRAPDFDALTEGRGIKVLELNALYSEPVHAYDPKYGLVEAWGIFLDYWRIATRTGLANMAAGRPKVPSRRIFFPKFDDR